MSHSSVTISRSNRGRGRSNKLARDLLRSFREWFFVLVQNPPLISGSIIGTSSWLTTSMNMRPMPDACDCVFATALLKGFFAQIAPRLVSMGIDL